MRTADAVNEVDAVGAVDEVAMLLGGLTLRSVILALVLCLAAALALASTAVPSQAIAEQQPTVTPTDVVCPSCPPPSEPTEALAAAEATFHGAVIEVARQSDPPGARRVTFDVEKTWTTETVTETATILVPDDVWECGRRPAVDEEWLIYAGADDEGRLTIGSCDRSHRLEASDPDLAALPEPCAPAWDLWIGMHPSRVAVGDTFTLTVYADALVVSDIYWWEFEPDSSVEFDRSCDAEPLGCQDLRVTALQRGQVGATTFVSAESQVCERGGVTWVWQTLAPSIEFRIRATHPLYRVWLPRVLSQ